jgi:hypothetical protein
MPIVEYEAGAAFGDRSIEAKYPRNRSIGSTRECSSSSTVQDSAPEPGMRTH